MTYKRLILAIIIEIKQGYVNMLQISNIRFWKILLFWAVSISITSCAFYTPQLSAPVTVKEKGQLDADLGISVASNLLTPGVTGSFAYAISDRYFTQIYTSALFNRNFHFQGLLGRRLLTTSHIDIRLSGGYFFGTVDLNDQSDVFGPPIYTKGSYQSYFGKLQWNTCLKDKRKNFGFTFLAGSFAPDLLIKSFDEETMEDKSQYFTDRAILYEPYFYYQYNASDKFGVTFSYAFSYFADISKNQRFQPNKVNIDYNRRGNFGISIRFLIK